MIFKWRLGWKGASHTNWGQSRGKCAHKGSSGMSVVLLISREKSSVAGMRQAKGISSWVALPSTCYLRLLGVQFLLTSWSIFREVNGKRTRLSMVENRFSYIFFYVKHISLKYRLGPESWSRVEYQEKYGFLLVLSHIIHQQMNVFQGPFGILL